MKIVTITHEYEHCGECPAALGEPDRHWCNRIDRRIPALWGDIPDWCPLETKEEEC